MNRAGIRTTEDVREIDALAVQAVDDEPRLLVIAQDAAECASGTEAGGSDQSGGR
jgi:hypothetical protein